MRARSLAELLDEGEIPVPGPGVAVGIRYGGSCDSDLHYWRHGAVREFRPREPLVLGYEIVGGIRRASPGTWAPPPGNAGGRAYR